MRVTVYDVLSYFAAGMTVAEILDVGGDAGQSHQNP
jgi:hypothetical protein